MEALLSERVLPFVDQHYWLPLYSMGAFATEREEKLGHRPTAGNQGRIGALREPLRCWSAFTEGHVTAEGIVSACCFDSKRDDGRSHPCLVGEGWNSTAFVRLLEVHPQRDVRGTCARTALPTESHCCDASSR